MRSIENKTNISNMDAKEIFDSVRTLEDWVECSSATQDGESSYLENKEVKIDLYASTPSVVGDFKLGIAKEMSAFANTDSGIMAIGIDTDLKVNNNTAHLEDWLDKNIRDMLEPQLSGISLKTCLDSKGREFVLMRVPKGNVIPYRTSPVKSCEMEKKNMREYFQRIGTNSVPIPMPIVRSLYLSNERSTDMLARVKPVAVHLGSSEERPYFELGIEIKPDQTRLINEYFLEANILLLDEDLKPLNSIPIDIVSFGLNSPNRPIIPPDSKCHVIETYKLQVERPAQEAVGLPPYNFPTYDIPDFAFDGIEYIPKDWFSKIKGFYVETKFACDGLPLKEDRRLLIFDSSVKNSEIDSRAHEMNGWSKECLVVSWFSVTEESGLYHKIVGFMHSMDFSG
ncbi:hypothetical protein BH11PAT4_BH11PAT4_3310 [soil metagenome]